MLLLMAYGLSAFFAFLEKYPPFSLSVFYLTPHTEVVYISYTDKCEAKTMMINKEINNYLCKFGVVKDF